MSRVTCALILLLASTACGLASRPSPEITDPGRGGAVPKTNAAPAEAKDARSDAAPASLVAGAAPPDQSAVLLPSQMIIRTGRVSIKVDSLDRAIRIVSDIAAAAGGYLANTTIQNGDNEVRAATLEVRVPADHYQGAVDRLGTIGKVTSVVTTSQAVGEEFVDVSARMSNARRLEERLITLLATRTGKLDDVLTVERELARVREEIERYEGRLRYLKAQVSMSTLTINVFEPGPLVGQPGDNVIVQAFKESWRNFVEVVARGIAMAGGLLPVVLLGVLAWVGVRALRRRFRSGAVASPTA